MLIFRRRNNNASNNRSAGRVFLWFRRWKQLVRINSSSEWRFRLAAKQWKYRKLRYWTINWLHYSK